MLKINNNSGLFLVMACLKTPIQKCVAIIGNNSKAAKELGVSEATISFWVNEERTPSVVNAMKLHNATKCFARRAGMKIKGLPTLEEIKPDFDWKQVGK